MNEKIANLMTSMDYDLKSYGYDSARDRPSCFASSTQNPESFMHYAG